VLRFELDRLFVPDALACVRLLERAGVTRIVLAGICFGARTALATAAEVPGIEGLLMFTPPVSDYRTDETVTSLPTRVFVRRAMTPRVLRNALRPAKLRLYLRLAARKVRRVLHTTAPRAAQVDLDRLMSPNFHRPLEALLGRGVPVVIVYGEADQHYADFEEVGRTSRTRPRPLRRGRSFGGMTRVADARPPCRTPGGTPSPRGFRITRSK
jgi:pimeloyl-ACP methyl ester carboxylesterase